MATAAMCKQPGHCGLSPSLQMTNPATTTGPNSHARPAQPQHLAIASIHNQFGHNWRPHTRRLAAKGYGNQHNQPVTTDDSNHAQDWLQKAKATNTISRSQLTTAITHKTGCKRLRQPTQLALATTYNKTDRKRLRQPTQSAWPQLALATTHNQLNRGSNHIRPTSPQLTYSTHTQQA